MGHHHQDSSGDTDDRQAGDAEERKTHVRQTRVADQQIQILLTQGHPGAVKQITDGQHGHHRQPAMCAVGHERDRHPKDRVQARLLENTRVHHGRGRGCGGITHRSPGMEREQAHQCREAEDDEREDPSLGAGRQRMGRQMRLQHGDIQTVRPSSHVERDEAHQGGERSEGQIQGDFESRPVAVFTPTPNTNHDEGGNQRQFVEEVEEEQIERGEGSHGPGDHEHQQHVEELHVTLDVPRHQHRGKPH